MSLGVFLKDRFHRGFGLTRGNVSLVQSIKNGLFALSDYRACGKCATAGQCNNETLLINSSEPVAVIDFENFARQFDGTAAGFEGGVCDYLLYSEGLTQVVFCDLTCGSARYLEPNNGKYPAGKRAKAFSQMRNSMMKILGSDDMLRLNLLTASRKRLLLGWREPWAPGTDEVESSMIEFGMTPSSQEHVLVSQQYSAGYGYEFIQVRYPEVYQWDYAI